MWIEVQGLVCNSVIIGDFVHKGYLIIECLYRPGVDTEVYYIFACVALYVIRDERSHDVMDEHPDVIDDHSCDVTSKMYDD